VVVTFLETLLLSALVEEDLLLVVDPLLVLEVDVAVKPNLELLDSNLLSTGPVVKSIVLPLTLEVLTSTQTPSLIMLTGQ